MCTDIQDSLPALADGSISPADAERLHAHLKKCMECAAFAAVFGDLDRELTSWGEQLAEEFSSPPESLKSPPVRAEVRRASSRIIVAAVACAAAVAFAVMIPRAKAPAIRSVEQPQFVPIPYIAPLDPNENATVVRMDIRLATLIGAGYRFSGDPDAVVAADVLVGEDGRAHAVRVLSDADSNRRGE